MDLVSEMHAIANALDAAGVNYAVCGGVAVTAYGAPRSNAAKAQQAMEGRLDSDGAIGPACRSFDEAVARRLEVLRALNRRREAMRRAEVVENA